MLSRGDYEMMLISQREFRDKVWESVRRRLDLPHDALVPATPAELEELMAAKKAEEGGDYADGIHFHDLMGILRTLNALEAEQRARSTL